jgi:hypothetical protein
MAFVSNSDFAPYIRTANLNRMIEEEQGTVDDAVATAISVIRDALIARYKVDDIFNAEGEARNKQILRWVIVLALYYLYERLPSNVMPERTRLNYEEVMGFLKDIEDGKKPMDLHQKTDSETGKKLTKFRFGSALPPRTHEY